MGKADEIELMRGRASVFLETARYLLQRGNYDIASFNAEQAAQLGLKSTLLQLMGDYPRTHSLVALLRQMEGKANGGLSEFVEENRIGLRALEDVYLTARYFQSSFEREDAVYLISLAEKVVALCERIGGHVG